MSKLIDLSDDQVVLASRNKEGEHVVWIKDLFGKESQLVIDTENFLKLLRGLYIYSADEAKRDLDDQLKDTPPESPGEVTDGA